MNKTILASVPIARGINSHENKRSIIKPIESSDKIMVNYFSHLNTMSLIRQIQPLVIVIQKHRGATMAFLAGNITFEPKITRLQNEIHNRCNRIKQLNIAYAYPISLSQWQEYENEYSALMNHWREDSVLSNYEFHSHFIDLLIQLMQKLSTTVITYTTQRTNQKLSIQRNLLAKITFNDVPQLIESIAKIRGIVTHATVNGVSDVTIRTKVKYLLQSIMLHQEELRSTLEELHKEGLTINPVYIESMLHEYKISQLYQLIKEEFLDKKIITAEGHSVFEFITDIIDRYANLFEQGINSIQLAIDETFALTRP